MKTALMLLVVVIAALALAEKTTVTDDRSGVLGNIFADAGRVVQGFTDNTGNAAEGLLRGGLIGRGTQKAVAGDLDLKVMMMEDGTFKGKCYCSCNLNNQPVFMELDSSNLLDTYAVV